MCEEVLPLGVQTLNPFMKTPARHALFFIALVTFSLQGLDTFAQGTAFTYQGRLNDGGAPANGVYDLRFTLFGTVTNGLPIDAPATNNTTSVSNGLFVVTLDFGPGIFTGVDYWLEIGVRTNGGGAFNALAPRQAITPTPYAIMANSASNLLGVVPSGALAGTYGNAVTFSNAGNNFTGSGGGLTGLNASQLTAGTVANARLSTNVAFVNSNQVFTGNNVFMRPVGIGMSPTFSLDVMSAQAVGRFTTTNSIYGAVVELINKQTNAAYYLGAINFNNAQNTFPGQIGYIVYVPTNPARDELEFRLAGSTALRMWNGVGAPNVAIGTSGSISLTGTDGDTIAGGGYNTIADNSSGVFIGAGAGNMAGPGVTNAVIAGGYYNALQSSHAVLGGGYYNFLAASNDSAVVVGGAYNSLEPYAPYSFIGGGYGNYIYGSYDGYTNYPYVADTIVGGAYNTIQANSYYSFIGGGAFNTIGTNAGFSVLAGGSGNEVDGAYSVIPGGYGNIASGNYSLAFGTYARALHDGSVVLSDGNFAYFPSTAPNQLSARFYGGVRFETSGTGMTLDGQQVLAGTVGSSQLSGTYTSQVDFNNPSDSFAGTFSGNGSGLTSLNASQLTTGIVPTGRLSGTYTNAVTFNNSGNNFNGAHSGNGISLTNLNASQLAAGTVPDARLSGIYSSPVTFNNSANSFSGSHSGNGGNLTNLNASQLVSGTVPAGVVAGLYTNAVILNNGGNIFVGNGNGLTNLNAAQLATGIIADARLSGNYSNPLILNNGGNSISGTFAGNGASLTNLNASQLASGTVPDARLSGTYSSAVILNNAGNAFSGSGSALTGLNASQLASGTVPAGVLSGNYTNTVTLTNAGNAFAGNGGGLTNLNANQLALGVVPQGRLAGQYTNQIIMTNAIDQFGGNGSMLSSVVQSVHVRGAVNSLINTSNTVAFAGAPTAAISLEAGQKVFISVSAVLGTTNASMFFDFGPAYSFNGGSTNLTDGLNYETPNLTSTAGHPIFSTSQIFLVPSTGSYVFGTGVRTSPGTVLNGNDYQSVAVMAFR